eukprot:scaffold14.g1043.t1
MLLAVCSIANSSAARMEARSTLTRPRSWPTLAAGAGGGRARLCRRSAARAPRASSEQDLDKQLLEDLERLRQRQAAGGGAAAQERPAAAAAAAAQQEARRAADGAGAGADGGSPLAGVKEGLDKLLIADFFFILAALAWLSAGLAERSLLHSTGLLDSWLGLWQWVFQPAIGVLMLGALVSGAVGWAKENLGGKQ